MMLPFALSTPKLLLAAVLAVAVAGAGGYLRGRIEGKKLERAEWQQRDNDALREANRALDAMHRKVADQERKHAEALAALAGLHDEEMNHVETERDAAVDAVRRGELRLRAQAATARLTCDVRVSTATASAAASVAPAEGEELSKQRAEAVVRLLSEADELAGEVNYCWSIVRRDRELVNR
jgi:uncharacterized membrane protein